MSARETDSQRVAALIRKLERWIEKRQAKRLDSQELFEAVRFLKDYRLILDATSALMNGGGDALSSPERR